MNTKLSSETVGRQRQVTRVEHKHRRFRNTPFFPSVFPLYFSQICLA